MTLSLQWPVSVPVAERIGVMTTAGTSKPRRDALNMRIPVAEHDLIDRAAEPTRPGSRTDLDAVERA
jgi:hypothetical protein